jgi:hypothetical protein
MVEKNEFEKKKSSLIVVMTTVAMLGDQLFSNETG